VIKGRAAGRNGRDVVLLGLSHENVARLFADEPMVIRTDLPPPEGVSLPGGPTIILIAGSDEDALVEKLRASGLVGGETHTVDDR
jgi:hypothetical protein